jgi:hypothetical protein
VRAAYVIVVSHHDRSGIIQALGPYASREAAEAAGDELHSLPLFSGTGLWEVVSCLDFGSEGQ